MLFLSYYSSMKKLTMAKLGFLKVGFLEESIWAPPLYNSMKTRQSIIKKAKLTDFLYRFTFYM